jgi:type II secretory pathway pseudopilin PulG
VRPRPGHLLVEALCALALGGVLAASAAAVLGGSRAASARLDARFGAERVAREAIGVAVALVRASDSVVVLGDTALDLSLRIGRGVVCGRDSTALWIAPARVAAGVALSAWTQVADVDDAIHVLATDSLTGARRWVRDAIDAAADRVTAEPCDDAHGWLAAGDATARMRVLTLRTGLPEASAGDPVRVSRSGRLGTYVDGKGEWMLGWRRCASGTCGLVQPVAGPLRTPGAGGFRVAFGADGTLELGVHAAGASHSLTAVVARADALR